MDDRSEDLRKVKNQSAEIDSEMRAYIGTDIKLRGKLYRQQTSLERKFMKRMVNNSRELLWVVRIGR